jgi:pimeloyl-ACP methyl ester carboxylesterase
VGAGLEMIDGAGHNLPIEFPQRVAQMVLDFAQSLPTN